MTVTVHLFARARDLAGTPEAALELPESSRVCDVRKRLAARFPGLAPLAPYLLAAINNEYVADDAPVGSSAQIAFFPPVSGG